MPELGTLAERSGSRGAARVEYRIALQLAKDADDSIGREDAEQRLAVPYIRCNSFGHSKCIDE